MKSLEMPSSEGGNLYQTQKPSNVFEHLLPSIKHNNLCFVAGSSNEAPES